MSSPGDRCRRSPGRRERRRRPVGSGEPRQAGRQHPLPRRHAGRRDQRPAGRLPLRARGDPRDCARRSGSASRSAGPSRRAARESWNSPRRSLKPPRSRASSSSSTRRRCRSGEDRDDRRRRSTAPTESTTRRLADRQLDALRGKTAWATCRSASPRPSTRSRRTRPCTARRRAGVSRCARSGRRSAPGFIYPICGDMSTMPGLSSTPSAYEIDIDDKGEIVGLS